MSDSRKTDLARQLYKGAAEDRDAHNSGDRSGQEKAPWWKLKFAGQRWGNHRRFKAREKVLDRRVERKDAQAELRETFGEDWDSISRSEGLRDER